ncbi:MAG: tetratricopeptide repeat protein, partial [Ignavibacteriaceae bacterium]
MSFFDDEYDFEGTDDNEDDNLRDEIEECRKLIDSGAIYGFLDKFDDVIQSCLDNDFNEDGLYLINALLEIAPYNSEYWIKKGLFLNALQKFNESIECYNKALSLNPGDSEALVDKSIAEENIGLYTQAKESLNNALTKDPNNEDAVYSLGILHQRNEEFEEAIKLFKKVIHLNPEYSEAYYEIGFCFENLH